MTLPTLKAAITARGFRCDWIASKLGVHPSLISHWIARRRAIPLRHHKKIARLLRLDLETVSGMSKDAAQR